jgi:hypothetical protein
MEVIGGPRAAGFEYGCRGLVLLLGVEGGTTAYSAQCVTSGLRAAHSD